MVPVLVLIWSQEEPDRIGELVCPLRSAGLVFTVGRAVEPLHHHGADDSARPTAALIHALVTRDYTTQVRELSEILLRSLTASDGGELLPPHDIVALGAPPRSDGIEPVDPDTLTREQVVAALERCGDVREQAWRALGLRNRYQFKRLLRRLGID